MDFILTIRLSDRMCQWDRWATGSDRGNRTRPSSPPLFLRPGARDLRRICIDGNKRLTLSRPICRAKRSRESSGDPSLPAPSSASGRNGTWMAEWLRRFGVDWVGPQPGGVDESDGEEPSNSTPDARPPRGSMVMEIEDYFNNRSSSSNSASASISKSVSSVSDWARSGAADKDWDDWESSPAVADVEDSEDAAELREQVIERRRARRGRRTTVRDEYLRPIVDVTGIYNRLAISEKEAEERVFIEAITNQYESREALKYAGILFLIPFSVAFIVSNLVAKPLWAYAEEINPDAFALRDEQKVEGAEAMHREEVRLRLESSIGQAPPLTEEEMFEHLHEEAVAFAEEMKEYNKHSLLNVVSDSSAGIALFVLLLQDTSQRAILFRTIGRVFTGLSDTAKAFIIILVTDTLLGYHSEEGWTAALTLVGHHYGVPAHKEGLQLFVATVPVILDSLFKYWIFVGLNKIDPAAAVTLRQMDRH